MYINCWYVMAQSEELGDQPLKVKALGQDFALYRDAGGKANCLADVCIHRGGSLAGGKVVGDCIQCPYHGLQYGGDGRCKFIPTLPEGGRIPERARVDAYPVEERYGLIFAFLGDLPEEQRVPILEAPEYGQDGWKTISLLYHWKANMELAAENALDATHAEFAHPRSSLEGQFRFGDRATIELVDYAWGEAYVIRSQGLDLTQAYHGISHQWAHMHFDMQTKDGTETGDFRFYSYVTPVDEFSVRRYLLHARNFYFGEEIDQNLINGDWEFEKEDRELLEDVRPLLAPGPQIRQMLLPEDQIIASYRNYLAQCTSKGWQVDQARVEQDRDRVVYAIPSPDRRSRKGGWVLDEIPRIPASRPDTSATGSTRA